MSDKRLLDALPAPIRPFAEKAIAFAKGLGKPARILIVTTVVALVGIGGYVTYHGNNPNYVTLFSNLDREDAAQVVAKLKEQKVPYRLEGDGTAIEVPEEKARELRLELASAGMPRGGAVGFESFDKMRLGATEFEQRILYRRALEGELSRTIGTVGAVQTARVHLVLPEKSVFVTKNEPSSASVVLKLRGGRALGPAEVNGIVHLVATSVAGLSPDRVAIVTTEGQTLHKPRQPGQDGNGDDEQGSAARTLEASLEERARQMVEKVTGAGHVDVRITADIDKARVERVEDHYDPSRTALRSEERSIEKTGESEIPVAGVPGAESNLPKPSPAAPAAGAAAGDAGAPAPVASATGTGVTRDQHTRNFEVDHVTEKRIVAGGVLRRLTVAVVLDGTPARSKEEVEKIENLVKNAVGFNAQRGDAVTVEAVPFLSDAAPAPVPAATPLFAPTPKNIGAAAGLALLSLVGVIVMVRSRRRAAARTALALATAKDRANAMKVEVLPAADTEMDKLPSADELKRLVHELAQRDPATAALVVRGWLGSAQSESREDVAA